MTSADETAKAIANELDSRERWILAWLVRHVVMPYRELSGETLDALVAKGLVQVEQTGQPKACWPVRCSELGLNVARQLRVVKTTVTRRMD